MSATPVEGTLRIASSPAKGVTSTLEILRNNDKKKIKDQGSYLILSHPELFQTPIFFS